LAIILGAMDLLLDLVELITYFLPAVSIIALSSTCREYKHFATLSRLWEFVAQRDYPYIRSLPHNLDTCRELFQYAGTVTVALCGRKKTGKTQLVSRLLYGAYKRGYIPTLVSQLHTTVYKTSRGKMLVEIMDCPGGHEPGSSYDVVLEMESYTKIIVKASKSSIAVNSRSNRVEDFLMAMLRSKFPDITLCVQDPMIPPEVS
jgi:hypothetical protein